MEEYRRAGQVLAWSTIRWLRQVKIIKIVGQVFVWPQPELAFGKTLMTVNSIWLTRSAAPSTALCDVIIITRTFRSRRLDWKTKIHFLIYLSAARVKCNKIQHLFGHKSKERQFSKNRINTKIPTRSRRRRPWWFSLSWLDGKKNKTKLDALIFTYFVSLSTCI